MIRKFLPSKVVYTLAFLVLLSLVSAAFTSVLPRFYSSVIDEGILTQDFGIVLIILLQILLISLINSVIKIYSNVSINKIGLYVTQGLKEATIKKVFNSPLNLFDKMSNGELIQRIREIDAITSLFNPHFLGLFVSLVAGVFSLVNVIIIDYRLLLVYLFSVPLLAFMTYKFASKYKVMTENLVELSARQNQLIHETISGITEVKSNNLISAKEREVIKVYNQIYIKTRQQNSTLALNTELIITINLLSSIGVTAIFAFLFIAGNMTIGQYIEITQYTVLIFAPAQMLSSFSTYLQPVRVILQRLRFFDKIHEQEDNKGKSLKNINSIQFKNVSFSYEQNVDSNENVIDSLDFYVDEKNPLLITGKNGSGKTTIVKLLLRLYDTYKGCILINGENSKEYSLNELRGRIGVVFQECFLFDGTLGENIICGEKKCTTARLEETLRLSGLVNNMNSTNISELLQIPVLEGGKNLSSGQKRMVSIARALLKKPCVLVLDEPTTFLDKESKELILNLVHHLKNTIIIVISHDDSLCKMFDQTLRIK